MRSRLRTYPWTQRGGAIRRIEWTIGLFSQRRRWRSLETIMKSDLEIENAASLTLRRIVARAVEAANDRALISPLARSAGSDAELKPSTFRLSPAPGQSVTWHLSEASSATQLSVRLGPPDHV